MIDRVWSLKAFMEEHGFFIDVVSTRLPGTIICEDGHQIVARPLKKR
jgi:hypothetical protein